MGANSSRPRWMSADTRPIHICFARSWDELGKGKTPSRRLYALLASHGLPVRPILRTTVGLHLLALQEIVKSSSSVVVFVRNDFLREVLQASCEETEGLEPSSWVFQELRWAVKWQKRVVVVLSPETQEVTEDILEHLAPSIRSAFEDVTPLRWSDKGEQALFFGKRLIESLGGTYKGAVPVAAQLRSMALGHLIKPAVEQLDLFTTADLVECTEEDFERVGVSLTDTDRSKLGLAKRVCRTDEWNRDVCSPVTSLDGAECPELEAAARSVMAVTPQTTATPALQSHGLQLQAGNWTGSPQDALVAMQRSQVKSSQALSLDDVGFDESQQRVSSFFLGDMADSRSFGSEGSDDTALDVFELARKVKTPRSPRPLYNDIESPEQPSTPLRRHSCNSDGAAVNSNVTVKPATPDVAKSSHLVMSDVLRSLSNRLWSSQSERPQPPVLPVTTHTAAASTYGSPGQPPCSSSKSSTPEFGHSRLSGSEFQDGMAPFRDNVNNAPVIIEGAEVLTIAPDSARPWRLIQENQNAASAPEGSRFSGHNSARGLMGEFSESWTINEENEVLESWNEVEEIDMMPTPPSTAPPALKPPQRTLRERHSPKSLKLRPHQEEKRPHSAMVSFKDVVQAAAELSAEPREEEKRPSTPMKSFDNAVQAAGLSAEPSEDEIEDVEGMEELSIPSPTTRAEGSRLRSWCLDDSNGSGGDAQKPRALSTSPVKSQKRNRLVKRHSSRLLPLRHPAGRALKQAGLEVLVEGLCGKLGIMRLHELTMVTKAHLQSFGASEHYGSLSKLVASFGELPPMSPLAVDRNGSLPAALEIAALVKLVEPLKMYGIESFADLEDADNRHLMAAVEQLEGPSKYLSFRLQRLVALRDRCRDLSVGVSDTGLMSVQLSNESEQQTNGPLDKALQRLKNPATAAAAVQTLRNASMTPSGRSILMESGAIDAALSALRVEDPVLSLSVMPLLEQLLGDEACLGHVKQMNAIPEIVSVALRQTQAALKGLKGFRFDKAPSVEEAAASMLRTLNKLLRGRVSFETEAALHRHQGLPEIFSVIEWSKPESPLCSEALSVVACATDTEAFSCAMAKTGEELLLGSARTIQAVVDSVPEKFMSDSGASTEQALAVLKNIAKDNSHIVLSSRVVPRLVRLLNMTNGDDAVLLAATQLVERLSADSPVARAALAKEGALVHLSALRNNPKVRASARKAAGNMQKDEINVALSMGSLPSSNPSSWQPPAGNTPAISSSPKAAAGANKSSSGFFSTKNFSMAWK